MSDTKKGFNLVVVKSVEVLQKFADLLELGVCKPLADEFKKIRDEMPLDSTELDCMSVFSQRVEQWMKEEEVTYFIVPEEAVWAEGMPLTVFGKALSEVGVPSKAPFLAANCAVMFEDKVFMGRHRNDDWVNKLRQHGVNGDLIPDESTTLSPEELEKLLTKANNDIFKKFTIGNVLKDEVFVGFSIGFVAKVDFNFWAALCAYNLDPGYGEATGKDFGDYLTEKQLAKCFPEGMTEESPDIAEFREAEARWAGYDADKQQSLAFEDAANLMPMEDLEYLEQHAPVAGMLNSHQIYCLASNLDYSIGGTTVRQALTLATDEQKQDKEFWINIVRSINFAAVQEHERRIIQEQGYAVKAVFATEPGNPDYAYSEGGDEKASFEAFAVVRGVSCRTLATFVDNYIVLGSQDEDFDITQLQDNFGTLKNGQPVRVRAIEADYHAAHKAGFCGHYPNSTRVVQILIPDTNNVLPDEEGYNAEDFPQQLFPLTAGEATLN